MSRPSPSVTHQRNGLRHRAGTGQRAGATVHRQAANQIRGGRKDIGHFVPIRQLPHLIDRAFDQQMVRQQVRIVVNCRAGVNRDHARFTFGNIGVKLHQHRRSLASHQLSIQIRAQLLIRLKLAHPLNAQARETGPVSHRNGKRGLRNIGKYRRAPIGQALSVVPRQVPPRYWTRKCDRPGVRVFLTIGATGLPAFAAFQPFKRRAG